MQIRQEKGCYTLYKENEAIGTAVVDGTTILRLEVVPRWRGRGYGSYLLKELLRQNGGLDPKQATNALSTKIKYRFFIINLFKNV